MKDFHIKDFLLKKKIYCILILLNALCLLAFSIFSFAYDGLSRQLLHEHQAGIWAGESEERYAQVSCFLPADSSVTVEDIAAFRQKVDEKLLEVSLEAEEGKSLYIDAYSGEAKLNLKNGDRLANVHALGVSENYFFFHNLFLRSGSYLTSWDLMQDRIVLDENTAWNLFGSFDVAGMELSINGKPFVVAGVVKRDQHKVSKLAEESTPSVVYLDYSVIADQAPIRCYELIMPNPISDFAFSVVKENFPIGERGAVLENSSRFRVPRIADLFFDYGKRLMQTDGIIYPSWENAARLLESRMSWLLLLAAISAILPLCSILVVMVVLYRRLHLYIKEKIMDRRIAA